MMVEDVVPLETMRWCRHRAVPKGPKASRSRRVTVCLRGKPWENPGEKPMGNQSLWQVWKKYPQQIRRSLCWSVTSCFKKRQHCLLKTPIDVDFFGSELTFYVWLWFEKSTLPDWVRKIWYLVFKRSIYGFVNTIWSETCLGHFGSPWNLPSGHIALGHNRVSKNLMFYDSHMTYHTKTL